MHEYIKYIIQFAPFLLVVVSLLTFLYASRKSEKQKWHKFIWAGMLLFSLPAVIAQLRANILPTAYAPLFTVLYMACFACGVLLVRKGNKMMKEVGIETAESQKLKDISKPVGLVFGIIAIPFSAFAIFAALIALIGIITTAKTTYEWPLLMGWVIFGVLSVLLSVVSWRLINIRKGWAGKLFGPYTLWFRLAGWLFLIAGLIKLLQRNLTGLWAIIIAIALIFLSGIKENKIAKTN